MGAASTADIFLAPIDARPCDAVCNSVFNLDELQKLALISADKRRQEFIAGHYFLRLALEQFTKTPIAQQRLQQLKGAAPQLLEHPNIKVSLSHSCGWVAIALTLSNEELLAVGVDIEGERQRKKLAELASYSFGEAWLTQHREHLLEKFFQRWTLCEALVKGSDKSLGQYLLNQQQFSPPKSQVGGHWLHHCRLDKEIDPKFAQPLHLSVALSKPQPIRCQLWQPSGSEFAPLPLRFAQFWAQ